MTITPFLKSPLTDVVGNLLNHQRGGPCADLELQTVECLEAYGAHRGIEKCDLLLKDFQECVNMDKQIKRFLAMKMERYRQYYSGERSKKELYAETPKITSY